ncbi:class I SAM-dependent methyltransferase [Streptomyces sp. NPDC049577]|uniref:class I SAM-dependent methyltransferase n=1 Tax=Streptomyces sp. NPDC049577 TaxID=3155153 RepID=UPI003423E23B
MTEETVETVESPAAPGRERRRTFGEAAEQYEAARPGYPDRLVDDVLEFAGPGAGPVLEVGAGTGKATLPFAARFAVTGTSLTCVEPDARMAGVLARNCADLPGVAIEVGDFENLRPSRRFGLLYCAQAWHWIDPGVRWERARAALRPGGTVALFWNDWVAAGEDVRRALVAAHERHLADMPPHTILDARPRETVMGPGSWVASEMGSGGGCTDVTHRTYSSVHERSTSAVIDLLSSLSAYRLIPQAVREALFAEVAEVVDAHGGMLRLETTTGLFLGRAPA